MKYTKLFYMFKLVLALFVFGFIGLLGHALFINASEENNAKKFLIGRPSAEEVRKMTSACKPTHATIATHVMGISEPRLTDPSVASSAIDIDTKWVRAEFRWDEIGKPDGSFDWTAYDSMVSTLSSHNINILATVNYFPPHVKDIAGMKAKYKIYLDAMVERYKPGGAQSPRDKTPISYWEIFNEPNSPGFGWFDGRAYTKFKGEDYLETYTYMLALSNEIIRKKDPNAVIVLGGLSPDGYPAFDFLDKLYKLGAADCFDVIAFHPYAFENKFSVAAEKLRSISASYNDRNKPLWFDEYGTTDNAKRSQMLTSVIREKNAADGFFWYTLVDYSNKPVDLWGVTRADGTKKPEYELLKELLH